MVLPISGPLRFSQIQSEFNQTGDFVLSDHYRGGGIVPATSGTGTGVAEVQSLDFSGATSNTVTTGQDELVSITLSNDFTSGFTDNSFSTTITINGGEPAGELFIITEDNQDIAEGDTFEFSGTTYTIGVALSSFISITPCLLYTSPSPRDS